MAMDILELFPKSEADNNYILVEAVGGWWHFLNLNQEAGTIINNLV